MTRVGQDEAFGCGGQEQYTSKRQDPGKGEIHGSSSTAGRSGDEDNRRVSFRGFLRLSTDLGLGEKQAVRAVPEKLLASTTPTKEATQPSFLLENEYFLEPKLLLLPERMGRPEYQPWMMGTQLITPGSSTGIGLGVRISWAR